MAKRSTPARTANGRFKKGGGTKAVARRTSSATTVRRNPPVTVAQFVSGKAPARRRTARRPVGAAAGGGVLTARQRRWKLVAAAAAYGYASSSDHGGQLYGYLQKVPKIAAIGAPATHGILACVVAEYTKGTTREIFDLVATAALMRAGHNLGAAGFNMSVAASMSGDDDLSGEIGQDDGIGYDEELRGE